MQWNDENSNQRGQKQSGRSRRDGDDHRAPAPATKRTRQQQQQQESDADAAMDVESSAPAAETRVNFPTEDEVLIDMIRQSGAKSYEEVVEFCISAGIPLSRMLRLDLIRESQGRSSRREQL
jgi:hypothetical protein